jgi:DnaK suppressor protein
MRDYLTIRQQLIERYEEIGERLGRVDLDLRHAKEPLSTLLDEQSIELQNDEVLAALDGTIRAEREMIERTLARLDQGAYGTCEHCGKLIPMRRLKALPFTSFCVECEAAREAGQASLPATSTGIV